MVKAPKMPTKIKVGYKMYRIEVCRREDFDHPAKVGEHDSCQGVIRIVREGLTPEEVVNTLLHEVLHACCWVGAVFVDSRPVREEPVVAVLTNQLQGVFRDNPGFVAWLAASARG